MAGYVACMPVKRQAYILARITEGKRPLRRSRNRGKNSIKMHPEETKE
jgi:hypothetical protein